jgi:SAM-dependent methyltransferase
MAAPERDLLKTTFDRDAERYDRARPVYPEKMFDDLVELAGLRPDASLLEVGCGTGRATLPLARRGFRIVCVELGENMAAVARRNLAPFTRVEVVVAPFETWNAGGDEDAKQGCGSSARPTSASGRAGRGVTREQFDLVYAASAWHWIDPDVGYRKAAELLKAGGSLAIIGGGHAFPKDADRFFFDIQDVYREIGEEYPDEQWPPPLPEDVPDMREEIEATGLFGDFQSRRYVWEMMYAAEEYVDLLNTFSGHISMEPEKREFLYRNVRELINARPDPRVRRHWLAILNLARRVP